MRVAAIILALLLLAPPAAAQLTEQAARQIELAQKDLDEGHYERAVNSASSALRLDPLLYDALVIKALAYEKLNEPMLAYSLLVTYQELTRGMSQNPAVAPALERLKTLIVGVVQQPLPAEVSVAAPPGPEDEEPAVRFELLSRRNQADLFDQMNKALEPGPAQISFRSQSRSKGDDFLFGLAQARWDRDDLEIDEHAFTIILDSEKLVTKARGGAKLAFPADEAEHVVQLWFDGEAFALRVDGEALGPFPIKSVPRDASWFLQLNDDARAWDLSARAWTGSLDDGIPSAVSGASRETTELEFTQTPLPGRIDEDTDLGDLSRALPDAADASVLRLRFTVTCTAKAYVIVQPGDGRELTLGRSVDVRGAIRLPKMAGGLACRGAPEEVEALFSADGSVAGTVDGRQFGPVWPGRRDGGGDPLFRVKGDRDSVHVEGLIYEVGRRKAGRRVFRAGKTE